MTTTATTTQLPDQAELLKQQRALADDTGVPVEELLAQLVLSYKAAMIRYQHEADRLRAELHTRFGAQWDAAHVQDEGL